MYVFQYFLTFRWRGGGVEIETAGLQKRNGITLRMNFVFI